MLEQSVQCLLMRGEASAAARQLQDAVDTCHAHHTLVYSHRAVLHTLLVCFYDKYSEIASFHCTLIAAGPVCICH